MSAPADIETIDPRQRHRSPSAPADELRLTLSAHPDVSRIGRIARLEPGPGGAPLSRLTPLFDDGAPLEDAFISRKPVIIVGRPDLTVDARGTRTAVALDGRAVDGVVTLDDAAARRGVALELGGQVTLWLERRPVIEAAPDFGLVGRSAGLDRVRREIALVADLDVPVLIRGASGSGKELVARALHGASRRRERPWVAVNMAAVPTELAGSTLFGHARGAFSGAVADHQGHFVRAAGGTLFMDEVGDTPPDVQVMLLRALETGEVLPVGAKRPVRVGARLISATDADLDDGRAFRAPLLHRLAGFQIHVPPLAARRADVGPLFALFARAELAAMGALDRLHGQARRPWLPAPLMTALLAHDWPGNVRQLRNVTRQLVILHRDRPTLDRWAELLPRLLGRPAGAPAVAPTPRPRYRHVDEVDDDTLVAALRAHGYGLKAAAEALGVSRTALYGRVDRCDRVRKAVDLSPGEIEAAGAVHADLGARAAFLEVSLQALKRRMKQLGLR